MKLKLIVFVLGLLFIAGCSTICGIPGISSLGVCTASPTATPTP